MKNDSINNLPQFADVVDSMVKERSEWSHQMALFGDSQQLSPIEQKSSTTTTEAAPINFREMISEIQDTSYLTHGLFYYPAKFIPHVPYYCVRHFCPEGGWVIDPFAGSGTVGLEAVLARRNAVLLDINPLLKHIADLKINFRHKDIDEASLIIHIKEMFESKEEFEPRWSNIDYWYYPEILNTLKRYWGWLHSNKENVYAQVLQCSLLRTSRRFSLTDHKAPKLFRSRTKLREMEQLIQSDWESCLKQFVVDKAMDVLRRVRALARITQGQECRAVAYAGVDSASMALEDVPPVDLVLTSPPYMQAQEYIRTFKLDLFWLGYSEEIVRQVSRLEIPYRIAPEPFYSPTYQQIYEKLTRADLREIMNSYFYYTVRALQNAAHKTKTGGFLCVFVGNPRVDGIEVETWRIIAEYFENHGFQMYGIYEDTIKNRQLFRGRRNKNPQGMPSEFLLVMRRK